MTELTPHDKFMLLNIVSTKVYSPSFCEDITISSFKLNGRTFISFYKDGDVFCDGVEYSEKIKTYLDGIGIRL